MRLLLTRDIFAASATLGRLTVDGKFFGYCVEDEDRGLSAADPATWPRKVRAETAIPVGTYEIRRTHSPKYGRDVMEVQAVPAFRGVRIHPGTDESDTEGCLLPGLQRDVAGLRVLKSTLAVAWLDTQVRACADRGERVTIEITRDPTAWAGVGR